MYGGQQLTYASATDPCAQAGSYGSYSATVVANCAKAGINAANFTDVNSGQIATLTGGNSKLRPETGRTWTVGTDFTPRWIPGLHTSLTYWHYTISNLISAVSTQYMADQCYTGQGSGYCNQIKRFAGSDQIDYATSFYTNQGGLNQSGLDWDVDYAIRVTPMDRFILSNNFQQILNYKQQNTAGGSWTNYTGGLQYNATAGSLPAAGIPRVRDYASITWRHGNFHVTYMMTFIGGMRWNNSSEFLTADGSQRYKAPAMVKNDLSLGYDLGRWSFTGGINNLNNKKPPYVVSTADNSMASVYGDFYEGRSFWLQVAAGF